MKTIIFYFSKHHKNTFKLLEAIKEKDSNVELFDIITNKEKPDFSNYDRVGFASGIYYSSFAKQILTFLSEADIEGKDIFFIYTCGAGVNDKFVKQANEIAKSKNANVIGNFGCYGYDTFGPFKLVGGLKKGHPDSSDIQNAVNFYNSL